jgi:hypothetical protein
VTGICTVSLSIGEFAGPFLGDLFYNDYGYEKTCFIFLILFFLTFLFYLGVIILLM